MTDQLGLADEEGGLPDEGGIARRGHQMEDEKTSPPPALSTGACAFPRDGRLVYQQNGR